MQPEHDAGELRRMQRYSVQDVLGPERLCVARDQQHVHTHMHVHMHVHMRQRARTHLLPLPWCHLHDAVLGAQAAHLHLGAYGVTVGGEGLGGGGRG